MNKIIHIPDEIVIPLKVLAAKSNVSLKKYIEIKLREIVSKSKQL